jgi:hypothetical protein
MGILPRTRKVKCCDGSIVTIYRNPADAFPLYLADEARRLSGGLKVVQAASARVGAVNEAKIEQLLIKITEANSSLQADFSAVYTAYAADPCLDRHYLRNKLDKILADRHHLETLLVQVRIIEVAITNGASASDIIAAVERALRATSPIAVQETVKMIAEAPSEVESWRQQ